MKLIEIHINSVHIIMIIKNRKNIYIINHDFKTVEERRRGGHLESSDFAVFRSFQANSHLPPLFLYPLNSFSWFFFADSSPFERYDERKFGRRLDRVFRPTPEFLNQGKGTAVFLVSWAFR